MFRNTSTVIGSLDDSIDGCTTPMQGKRNPRANDPPVDNGKNPHFLVLISENFLEARATLSRAGVPSLPSNQSPVKMDVASVTGPSTTSMPSGCLMDSTCFFLLLLWHMSMHH